MTNEEARKILDSSLVWPKMVDEECEALDMAINALEQTRWIPVSERLPEKPDNYPYCGIYRIYFLVSLASGCVKTLGYEFDRDEWQVTGSPVIAWMPLPEPYVPDTNVGNMAEREDCEGE